jgi:hypothetical protein
MTRFNQPQGKGRPMIFALIVAILLPMLLATAFLLGRHLPRRRDLTEHFSPVTRQHIEIFQGGQMNEAAVESAKRRFRYLFERGEEGAVEASLRPGMHFVFQVRALAEIGTDAAGKILERQLHRHLTDDQLEQAWYWIDLAGSLRALNRVESLPQLLRCSEAASKVPLGHFFAAETVCFLGFAGYVRQAETPLGRSALRVLHHALEGLRHGLPPQVVAEARLGELVENLWDNRPDGFPPLVTRVFHEALRFLRRVPHARAVLLHDPNESEALEWQFSRLAALEPALVEFLEEAPAALRKQLAGARDQLLDDLLRALIDLRVDAGTEVLAMVQHCRCDCLDLAVESLTWSKSQRAGEWLRAFAADHVPMQRRSQWRLRTSSPGRVSLPREFAYQAILRALRGHPSAATERFLILAAQDWDPVFRGAAFCSLGWWEPILKGATRQILEAGRRDPSPEVRQASRAALARLGERAALHWFRQGLTAEDPVRVQEAVQVIVNEGLTLLWPDLDRLADSEATEIAQLAREALERMAEDMDSKRS